MSTESDATFAKWFLGILAVVIIMWIFELGPFEESTPAPQPIVNGWNGSFTGRAEDRLETGVNNKCKGGHCDCQITKRSLKREGFAVCPKCGDSTDDHRN